MLFWISCHIQWQNLIQRGTRNTTEPTNFYSQIIFNIYVTIWYTKISSYFAIFYNLVLCEIVKHWILWDKNDKYELVLHDADGKTIWSQLRRILNEISALFGNVWLPRIEFGGWTKTSLLWSMGAKAGRTNLSYLVYYCKPLSTFLNLSNFEFFTKIWVWHKQLTKWVRFASA